MDSYEVTFKTYNKVALAYQEKFMNLDLYNDTYDIFCRLVYQPKSKVLEIGCGPGNITKYLLSKRPDLELEAIDVAPNMINLAKENNPAATFKLMDARTIDSITSKYEGIVCGFCLPYLSQNDVVKFIKDCYFLLNKDGIFYFSTIAGEYHQSGYETGSNGQDKVFVYYHSEDFLQEQIKKYSFELVHLIRKVYPQSDGTSSTHLIFVVKKF